MNQVILEVDLEELEQRGWITQTQQEALNQRRQETKESDGVTLIDASAKVFLISLVAAKYFPDVINTMTEIAKTMFNS